MSLTFLFGAGAEGGKSFNLPNGNEFLSSTIFSKETNASLYDDLSIFFNGKTITIQNQIYKHSKHTFNDNNIYATVFINVIKLIYENDNKRYWELFKIADKVIPDTAEEKKE